MNGAHHDQGRGSSGKGCFIWGCVTIVVLGVLIAGGIGAFVYYGYQGATGISSVAESYLAALERGDYQQAYDLLTPSRREDADPQELAHWYQQAEEKYGRCSQHRMSSLNVRSGGERSTAEIGFVLSCDDGEARVTVTMAKADGEWLVDDLVYDDQQPVPLRLPITCPSCGTVNPPESNFCSKCGERLAEP